MMRPSNEEKGASLSKLVAKGGLWIFVLQIVKRAFDLIRLVILANLLLPKDFGLFGISLLVISTINTFTNTGFRETLIQKKGDIDSFLNATWTLFLFRGFFLFLITVLIAPYVEVFFKEPGTKAILRAIGFSLVLHSLTNVGVLYFQKELAFNRQFIYQLSGTVTDFIVSVISVILLKNAWALVLGLLSGKFIMVIVSYLVHPYRPRLEVNLFKIRALFKFGKWILSSSILIFLLTQGDDFFVGKMLGASLLGFYQMAYKISNLPATEISHLISTVTFPAYAKLQDNVSKLKVAFLKVLQLTSLIAFPVSGMIFILAPMFTEIFLGEKWMPMIPALQVLAIYGLLRALGATTGVVFIAVGKPEIRTKIQIAQLVLLVAIIYPLAKWWSITGVAVAVTVYALVFNLTAIFIVLSIVKARFLVSLQYLIFPLIGSIVSIFIIKVLRMYLFFRQGIIQFLLLSVIGVSCYILFMYFVDLFGKYGYRNLLLENIRKLGKLNKS